MAPIRCLHMNHINAVVDGFDRTVDHFQSRYGAQFLADMPKAEWHACLMAIGGVIFQLFAPHDDLLHARTGPHYIGIEYQVPDVTDARAVVQDRGIRIIRELGAAFHVHPADAFGVALEFFDQSFHATPPPIEYLEPVRPPVWWRDGHPLGVTGLKRYSVAVGDLDAAVEFFGSMVDGTVAYEAARPAVAGRAVGMNLGDTTVELIAPVGEGTIERHVARWGDGIRAVVFAVEDIEVARRYFADAGAVLRRGDADGAWAADPAQNAGLLFELAE